MEDMFTSCGQPRTSPPPFFPNRGFSLLMETSPRVCPEEMGMTVGGIRRRRRGRGFWVSSGLGIPI